jgi:hypothetical protein
VTDYFDSLFPPVPRPYSAYAPIPTRSRRAKTAGPHSRASGTQPSLTTLAEREAEIARIARQLGQVAQEIPWERIQNDAWDRLCPFIFRLRTMSSVRLRAQEVARQHRLEQPDFEHYALRRWYCFWGARVAELLFANHPGVVPGPSKDHEVDFTIDGVPFDLKTSEVPRAFARNLGEVLREPEHLARWFYAHQSRQHRYHTANRLFLILWDTEQPDEAWRLRGDVAALRVAIGTFLERRRFRQIWVSTADGRRQRVVTGVIPVLRLSEPRQLRLSFPPELNPALSSSLSSTEVRRDEQLPLPFGGD